MHDTAVIPDHDVISLPVVAIHARRIDDLPIDTIDQVATGKVVHADDGLCVIAKVYTTPASFWVSSYKRMVNRRHSISLSGVEGLVRRIT